MSNYVQGAKTAAGAFTPSFATLAAGAFAIGTAIDLTAVVPFEVLFEVTAGIGSAPASTNLGINFYLQYSLDGTNWSSFTPATTVGATQMEFIGFVPVPDATGAKTKVFTSQGHPTCRWIRPVMYNGTGVVLTAGSMNYGAITGS
jgi:hypothetical protein